MHFLLQLIKHQVIQLDSIVYISYIKEEHNSL